MEKKRPYGFHQVTPEDKIRLDRERSHEERIIALLRLIRYSNIVAEAGEKYRRAIR